VAPEQASDADAAADPANVPVCGGRMSAASEPPIKIPTQFLAARSRLDLTHGPAATDAAGAYEAAGSRG